MSERLDLPPGLAFTVGTTPGRVVDAALRARRFARAEILPVALALDGRLEHDHEHFPWDLVRAGAREGWLTAALPRFLGGGGAGIAEMAAVMEEMCAADAGVANIFGAHGLGMLPLLLAMETDLDLARSVLAHVARAERGGEPILCAFAITEPGGGSDVEEAAGLARGDVRSHAVAAPGGHRLFGRKVFISNGNVAEYVVVFAAADRAAPASSWTAYVVRRGTPGLGCPRVERKLGQRACPAAELVLDGAFVPAAMRLSGGGWQLTRRVLAVSRGPVGAIAVGTARGAFEAACEHVRAARAAGVSGADAPWIDDALARMVVRLRAARAAYLEAALHCDQVLLPGRMAQAAVGGLARLSPAAARRLAGAAAARAEADPAVEAAWAHQCLLGAAAKVAGSDAAMAVATVALDLIPVTAGAVRARAEKAFRDAKLTQIYEGTNQINLRAIAHESGLSPAVP